MPTFIIIGILVFGFILYTQWDEVIASSFIGRVFECFCFSALLLAIVVIIVGAISAGIIYLENNKIITDYNEPIISIDRENRTEGSFTLGSGRIEGKDYYYFYYPLSDNRFQLGRAPALDVVVEESTSETPKVYYKSIKENSWLSRFWDGKWIFWIADKSSLRPDYHYYKIIVPKNTIVKEFRLN